MSSAPASRRLKVMVVSATNLLAMEKDGTADPYVTLELIDGAGRVLEHEAAKTQVLENTKKPEWNESFTLGRKINLNDKSNLPSLRLQVFDKEKIFQDRPMGQGIIPLIDLGDDGVEKRMDLALRPFGKMRSSVTLLGSVQLVITLTPLCISTIEKLTLLSQSKASMAAMELENTVEGEVEGDGDDDDEGDGGDDTDPNLLRVEVIKARNLPAADFNFTGKDTSDPVVTLRITKTMFKTKVIKENCDPEWNEVFEFPVRDSHLSLELIVEDYDIASNEFLGRVTIHVADFAHNKKVRKWYELLDKKENRTPGGLGEIELGIQWLYSAKAIGLKSGKSSFMTRLNQGIGLQDKSSDTEEGASDHEDDIPDQKSAEQVAEEARKKEEEEKALGEILGDMEVKSGDYMLYVHIIEVRDLKAEDVNGLSDPVVFVSAFGQKLATEVKKECLNAVYDEQFVISLRNMDKEEFEQGVIRITVSDADGPAAVKLDLIGAYSFDATYVYFQKDHELHRKWLALTDDENPEDSGTQGYLKASIQIVGPGDKLKTHDEAADRKREVKEEASAGGIDKLVMMPPNMKQETQWLVTTAWRADYLPVMDQGALMVGGGDYFFAVEVAGAPQQRSKKKTLKGNRNVMNPVWRYELWTPVIMPCMSGVIKNSVWDWDAVGENEMVGAFYHKIKELQKLPRMMDGPKWYNLYGAPLYIPDSSNLKRLGKRAAMLEDVDWQEFYNNFPDRSSTYRGRALVQHEIRPELPESHASEKVAWRRKVKRLSVKKEPVQRQYCLRALVALGTEIPKFQSLQSMKTEKMAIRVSVGKYEVTSEFVDNNNGICEWYNSMQINSGIKLPADPAQVPDVLVHLLKNPKDQIPVSFYRISGQTIVNEAFKGKASWIMLGEDKVLDCMDDGEFPGSVLVKLGFGTLKDYLKTAQAWQAENARLKVREPYQVRVHIYQGRDLPAADDNGLMDPYLKINLLGKTINSEIMEEGKYKRRETLDPLWYFTSVFDVELPPEDVKDFFPQVNIQLFDWDMLSGDDYCGTLFFPLSLCDVEQHGDIRPAKRPTWHQFFLEEPGDSSGELLCSFQVIKKESFEQVLAPPESIVPAYRPAFLDVIVLGIRNLEPYKMVPIQLPYAELEMDLPGSQKFNVKTNTSKKPSGSNANFLERIKLDVQMPVDEIFAPRMKIRITDVRLGGFLTPLVGAGSIDLVNKLPWSASYEPPMCQGMNMESIMDRAGAPVIEGMLDEEAAAAALDGLTVKEGEVKEADRDGGGDGGDDDDDDGGAGVAAVRRVGRRRSTGTGTTLSPVGEGNPTTKFLLSDCDEDDEDDDSDGDDGDDEGDGGSGGGGRVRVSKKRGSHSRGSSSSSSSQAGNHHKGSVVADSGHGGGGGGGGGGDLEFVKVRSADMGVGVLPLMPDDMGEMGPGSGEEEEEGAGGALEMVNMADRGAGGVFMNPMNAPELVVTDEPRVEEEILSAMGQGDNGMGIFPALLHVPEAKKKVKEDARRKRLMLGTEQGEFDPEDDIIGEDDLVDSDEEEEGPPKYMLDREVFESEMEEVLKTTPFETYPLFRGQKFGGGLFGGDEYRQVGRFKCIMRITEKHPDEEPLFSPDKEKNEAIILELLKPQGYKIRLYVLQGQNLTPMDMGIGGRPGKSDPYLLVKLGKDVFDDKENHIDDVTEADFYKCVEMATELPGAGILTIDVMDYDDIGSDELIGRTTIDLEDRWFDQRWQLMGMKNRNERVTEEVPLRWQTKPIEARGLFVPTSNAPQGVLQCWVDIMPPGDAGAFEPDPIALPPPMMFEVRLVVWKCKEVVSLDFTGMNDLFCKVTLEGSAAIETDTHWRAKKGKASWNWRMRFPVELGPRARAMKFPYLTLQLWDKDILKWNDCIAESMMDVGKYYRKAYKKKEVVKLFRQKTAAGKAAEAVRAQEMLRDEENALLDELRAQDEENKPLLGEEMKSEEVEVNLESGGGGGGGGGLVIKVVEEKEGGAADGDGGGGSMRQVLITDDVLPIPEPIDEGPRKRKKKEGDDKKKKGKKKGDEEEDESRCPILKGCCCCLRDTCCCCCPREKKPQKDDVAVMSEAELQAENDRRKELGLPEISAGDYKTGDTEADDDAKAFVKKIKELMGMDTDDPIESYWMKLERTNREKGTKEPMGQVCIGMQIWPMELAQLQPVGPGRDDPNNSPYCPPPAGRLQFSFNPFVMGSELLGPALCAKIVCCCVCIGVMLLLIFCQPVLNLAIALFIK